MNYTLIIYYYGELENKFIKAMTDIVLVPVIYDEVPFFIGNNEYPFERRKNTMQRLLPNILGFDASKRIISKMNGIKLMRNVVCINDNIWSGLLFWK